MFEKEIKFIADVNLNKIKAQGAFITFDKLVNNDVHPAIIQYISAELDYLIHEDRKKLLEQSVFDYSGPEIAKHFYSVGQELKKSKKISFEDIKKLILQAVSFNINYLMRPKWSLAKLVYNDAGVKNVEELKLSFNYVYFYEYLKNIFLGYISKRKLVSLTLSEFDLILDKIDKELFDTDRQKLIEYSLYTMADFFNLGGTNKKLIHPAAVELFLKEKKLDDILLRLKNTFTGSPKQPVEIEEIKRIIFSSEPIEIDTGKVEKEPYFNIEHSAPDNEFKQVIDVDESIGDGKTRITIKNKPDFDLVIESETEGNQNNINENREEQVKKNLDPEKTEKEIVNETNEKPEKTSISEPIFEKFEAPVTENEIEPELEPEIDENLLALYESEMDSIEDDIEDFEIKEEDIKESVPKENIDDLLDFEEDTQNLLDEFSSSNEEDDEILSSESPDKSDENEINNEEVEELTRSFLTDDDSALSSNSFDLEEMDLEKDDIHADLKNQKNIPPPKVPRSIGNDILDYLSNKDIEKIVSNVFNEDREDFANTMEKLTECDNYDEATEILKSVFLTYRVNPYSKEAVTLTNSVANYFSQG